MTRPLRPHPRGWEVFTLEPNPAAGFILEAASGSTPPTGASECWGGTVPWLTPKEITDTERSRFVGGTERTLTREGLRNAGRLWAPGTVMLTKRAPVGIPVMNVVPMATNQGFLNLVCGPKLSADFLYYWLKANGPYLDAVANGSTYPELYVTDLFEFEVSAPPRPVQNAIAGILGAIDDKIELLKRMNETVDAMARALFKSWFVDFDPVRASPGTDASVPADVVELFPRTFAASEIGEIPLGWDCRALYDCANYINGSAFKNEAFSPRRRGLPIIKIAELKDGITRQTKFVEGELAPKYRVTSGDILFSWSGSPDTSIDTFVWTGADGWLNQHIFKLGFKRPIEKLFVHYLLRHLKPVFIEIARNKQTTGLGHVTAEDLKLLRTAFPPDDILLAFNAIVTPLFQRSYSNGCEARLLASMRDALLPRLVSGALSLKPVGAKAAEAL